LRNEIISVRNLSKTVSTQTIEGVRFGEFLLDTQGRRLLLDGKRVALGPLEFKLLETFIRNRGRVLTGDELRILVWANDPSRKEVPAGDVNALYVSIRKLRAALGDAGKWIVNIPKVGYTISSDAKIEELSASASDVPEDVTPFVGREKEIALIRDSLLRTRLVTLTGPPGVGKTRLAKEVAKSMADRFGSGVHFIDLTSVEDGQYVTKAVLSAFDLPDSHETDLKDGLSKFFKDKSVALILDNCEHVIDDASNLVENLCNSGRGVHVIATSREPLLLPTEAVIVIQPLSVPPKGKALKIDAIADFEAVRLFIGLADQRRPDIAFADRDLPFVGNICRQLEGIPVAIELAAAQVDAYSVEQISAVVKDRFRLLQRRGSESSKHNTLEAAIEWSYNLLSSEEQTLLRRLSVLRGGWTSEIASKVCSDEKISGTDIFYLMASLVRRSLIQMYSRKGVQRYNMLEMIRQYGRRRLSDAGEQAALLTNRTAVLLDLVERSFDDGDRGEWPAILDAEYDNIRAVLARTIEEGDDIVSGLRMCGALSRFWFNHGHIGEAQTWTKKALEKDNGSSPPARAKALMAAGFFFGQTPGMDDDTEVRRSYFEESIRIWKEVGDKRNLGVTLVGYAFFLNRHGEHKRAEKIAEQSLEVLRQTDSFVLIARAANNLALTLLEMGEFQRSLPILEEALRDARISNDVFLEAVCLHNMGEVAMYLTDLEKAEEFAVRGRELFESLGLRPNVALTKLLQSEILVAKGGTADALDLQRQVLAEFVEIGDSQGIASALEAIGSTLAFEGKLFPVAAQILNSAAALRKEINITLGPARQRIIDEALEKCRSAVGEVSANLTTSKAIDAALAV
jgi:predicted ATPase